MKEQDSLCPQTLNRRGFLTTAATALTASTAIAARGVTARNPAPYAFEAQVGRVHELVE